MAESAPALRPTVLTVEFRRRTTASDGIKAGSQNHFVGWFAVPMSKWHSDAGLNGVEPYDRANVSLVLNVRCGVDPNDGAG